MIIYFQQVSGVIDFTASIASDNRLYKFSSQVLSLVELRRLLSHFNCVFIYVLAIANITLYGILNATSGSISVFSITSAKETTYNARSAPVDLSVLLRFTMFSTRFWATLTVFVITFSS